MGETKYCIYLFIKQAEKHREGERERETRGGIMKCRRNEWASLLNGSVLDFKDRGRGSSAPGSGTLLTEFIRICALRER